VRKIRAIMLRLDHPLATRPENLRQTIQRTELGAIAGARESPQKQTRNKHKKGYTLGNKEISLTGSDI